MARRNLVDHHITETYSTFKGYGRLNLIGDHTDYHQGLALPLPLEQGVWTAVTPTPKETITLKSTVLDRTITLTLGHLAPADQDPDVSFFAKILAGVVDEFGELGVWVRGCRGIVHSDVPAGAGLGSSAALSVSLTGALALHSAIDLSPVQIAQLAFNSERRAGACCGELDHWSAICHSGGALLMDFYSHLIAPIELPRGLAIVALDCGLRRQMASGRAREVFLERRDEGRQVCEALGVKSLRGVGENDLAGINPTLARRARHVISENARVQLAVMCLREERLSDFGACLNASHASLRDDYEVSSLALDKTVEAARSAAGCLGARMTGGGFGGYAVAAVRAERVSAFLLEFGECGFSGTIVYPRRPLD